MRSALVLQTDEFQELLNSLHCFIGDRRIKELGEAHPCSNIRVWLVAFQFLAEDLLS
jgi:hypothetical protein